MASTSHSSALHVAVGVIRNAHGEVLIARRHEHLHQGGLWEFPGGKIEPEETVEQALRRELFEELSISAEATTPLIKIHHDYGDKQVLLDVRRVDAYTGSPHGRENQAIRWVSTDDLHQFDFPSANRPIITAASLPEFYPIIDGSLDDVDALFAKLENLCQNAYRLAQWRVRFQDESAYLESTRRAVAFCKPYGLQLLLNAEPIMAIQTGAAGIHLNSRRLLALQGRPIQHPFQVAASCHNPEEIRHAERIGIDFILLSPVLPTPSHPEAIPLGWNQFGAWVEQANLPVFALGGMTKDQLGQARQHGAQGIAGIRGFGSP